MLGLRVVLIFCLFFVVKTPCHAEIHVGDRHLWFSGYQLVPRKGADTSPLPKDEVFIAAFEPMNFDDILSRIKETERPSMHAHLWDCSFDARDLLVLFVYRIRQKFHGENIPQVWKDELDERLRFLFAAEGRLYVAFSFRTPTEDDPSPIEVHLSIGVWPETVHGIPYQRTHVPRGARPLLEIPDQYSPQNLTVTSFNGERFHPHKLLTKFARMFPRKHRRRVEVGLFSSPDPMNYKFYGLMHPVIEIGHGTFQSNVAIEPYYGMLPEYRVDLDKDGKQVLVKLPTIQERELYWMKNVTWRPTSDILQIIPEMATLEGVDEVVAWTARPVLGEKFFIPIGFERQFSYQLRPSLIESPENGFPPMEFFSMPISRWQEETPNRFKQFGDTGFEKVTLLPPIYFHSRIQEMVGKCQTFVKRIAHEMGIPDFEIPPFKF